MDVYKTPGAFSWSELTTSDPGAAARFYGGLFGWSVSAPDPAMGDYRVASVGDIMVAGISAPFPGSPPVPPHWGVYVTVASADETAAKCEALGGKTLMAPMDVPTVGRMAVLQDPQGAVFCVMAYSEA